MEKAKSRMFLGFLLVLLLVGTISVCSATESDVYCLRSVKESLHDPFNNLETWDFSNTTEGFICRFVGVECWHVDESKILNIVLRNMGLTGEFPRGLRNCTSLTGLDLSGNTLYGTIPSDISSILEHVTTLDLSNNSFSGDMPTDIANCRYLNVLKLDYNDLGGEIPSRIGYLSRLKTFTVANNYLTGSVPSDVSEKITAESLANNPELCGKPLKECEDSWIWKHIDRASFIQAFGVGWIFFCTLCVVLRLFHFPIKAIDKIVSLDIWKLMRKKEHLASGSEEELSSQRKDRTGVRLARCPTEWDLRRLKTEVCTALPGADTRVTLISFVMAQPTSDIVCSGPSPAWL